jgi:hypothetical protein
MVGACGCPDEEVERPLDRHRARQMLLADWTSGIDYYGPFPLLHGRHDKGSFDCAQLVGIATVQDLTDAALAPCGERDPHINPR